MIIRRFTKEDKPQVFGLLNNLYNNSIEFDNFSKIYDKKLNEHDAYYIVCEVDDKIVAVLTSEIQVKLHRKNKQSFIEDLVVDPAFRGRGIGSKMLENAIAYAKSLNCDVVELTTYINNAKAHEFYIKNGFEKQSYKFKLYLK